MIPAKSPGANDCKIDAAFASHDISPFVKTNATANSEILDSNADPNGTKIRAKMDDFA